MTEEKESNWLYCNYCGESLLLGRGIYYHMLSEHPAEVHVGPGEFEPGRYQRSMRFLVAGLLLTMATNATFVLVFGGRLNDITGPLWAILFIGSILGIFVGSELYASKGVKSSEEIVQDLITICGTCGERVPYRDSFRHTEVYHPEEYQEDRQVYDRFGIVFIGVVISGFVGMGVSLFFPDDGSVWGISEQGRVLFVVSLLVAVIGVIMGFVFQEYYHEPRTERLAKEWAERRPGSKRK
jgi:hypothetical protein